MLFGYENESYFEINISDYKVGQYILLESFYGKNWIDSLSEFQKYIIKKLIRASKRLCNFRAAGNFLRVFTI